MIKIPICGVIGWDCTPQDLREALNKANGEEVEFEFSSPGGFIAPGLEMFNLIRNYPGKVNALITGYAMSMASYLPLAVKANRQNPGTIRAEDNAVYMIHNARGGAFGDHVDILGYGEYLKGLSTVIAKQYVKHTGKPLDEISALMDKETFFFGEEMVESGFVDEMVETAGDDDDKDSAVATAKAAFTDAVARMSEKQEEARADWQRAAALLEDFQPPANAGINQQEEQQMVTLKKLLADNPDAKAEFDQAIADATAAGEQAGVDKAKATINKVAPYLASKDYPPLIGTTALAVLKGESDMTTLMSAVTAVDAVKEQNALDAAAGETNSAGETNGQQQEQSEPGALVSTEAELQADLARVKEGN